MGIEMGTLSSARIIQYVDLVLKLLEIVYSIYRAVVEWIPDNNGHRKKVVGER